jgi:hypothetical protein
VPSARTLTATVEAPLGPFTTLYPDTTTYPATTLYPGFESGLGVLTAAVDTPQAGTYPGTSEFPSATEYPGKGTNLGSAPPSGTTLTASPIT